MYSIFPFTLFGKIFWSSSVLQVFLNQIWFVQILVCLCFCFKYKRYWPQKNTKYNIYIKQIHFYFFVLSLLYIYEIFELKTFYLIFEKFLHHVLAILLFVVTYLKPQIISVLYLIPYLIHSIYWLKYGFDTDLVLLIYNISILVCSVIIMIKSYNRRVKTYSLRVLLLSGLLYNVNIFGAWYGYDVKILNLDMNKCFKSMAVSIVTSLPFYFYLVYVNMERKLILSDSIHKEIDRMHKPLLIEV